VSRAVLSPNLPAVHLHDRPADREPDTQALPLGAEERLKHPGY